MGIEFLYFALLFLVALPLTAEAHYVGLKEAAKALGWAVAAYASIYGVWALFN